MSAVEAYLDRAFSAGISSFRGKRQKAAEFARSQRRISYDMPLVGGPWERVDMVELANNRNIVWIRDEEPLELSAAVEEDYKQQIDAAVNAIMDEGFTVQDHVWGLWQAINHPRRHDFPRSSHDKALKALQKLVWENGDAADFVCKLMDRKAKVSKTVVGNPTPEPEVLQSATPEPSDGRNLPPEPEEVTQGPGGVYDVYTGQLIPEEEGETVA